MVEMNPQTDLLISCLTAQILTLTFEFFRANSTAVPESLIIVSKLKVNKSGINVELKKVHSLFVHRAARET